MDLYEVQETIRKHITVIKKTIIKPLGFDIIFKIPKDKVKNGEKKHNEHEKVRTEDIGNGSA
jgi:hypothetical protein